MSGKRGSLLTAHLLLLTACAVTPLTNKIAVGEQAFVIAVGEGPDSLTDLYAAPAQGGRFVRLTFNRAEERGPRLAPEGTRVAFLRRAPESERWTLVILDLRSNVERSAELPAEAPEPEQLGWSGTGEEIVLRAGGGGLFRTATLTARPKLAPVGDAAASGGGADSVTRERLGPRGEGVVQPCDRGLCIAVGSSVTPLGQGASGAVRWGADSVGYFLAESFEVRPLAGGYARRPDWSFRPARLRELTYHGGQVTTRTGVSERR